MKLCTSLRHIPKENMSSYTKDAAQALQRLNSLSIIERSNRKEPDVRDYSSEACGGAPVQVPATPCTAGSSYKIKLRERRKRKVSRTCSYNESNKKARKSLSF